MKIKSIVKAANKKCPYCRHRLTMHDTFMIRSRSEKVFVGCRATKRGKFCRCSARGK